MEDSFNEVVLPQGRQFELDVLGVHGESSRARPEYLNFEESIAWAVRWNWENYALSLNGEMEWHNPMCPSMGMTKQLWDSVGYHLSKISRESGDEPLNLYISVGFNSLDYYHGVDAFFWWQGVCATVDLSLKNKWRNGTLKADFLISMVDITRTNLELFGEHVALFLERERFSLRLYEMERRRQALHNVGDYVPFL